MAYFFTVALQVNVPFLNLGYLGEHVVKLLTNAFCASRDAKNVTVISYVG